MKKIRQVTGLATVLLAALASVATSTAPSHCDDIICANGATCVEVEQDCGEEYCEMDVRCEATDGTDEAFLCQSWYNCPWDLACDTANHCETYCPTTDNCYEDCYGLCVTGDCEDETDCGQQEYCLHWWCTECPPYELVPCTDGQIVDQAYGNGCVRATCVCPTGYYLFHGVCHPPESGSGAAGSLAKSVSGSLVFE